MREEPAMFETVLKILLLIERSKSLQRILLPIAYSIPIFAIAAVFCTLSKLIA